MLTHRVSEYFGNIIEVEHKNTNITQFSKTHYGNLPWAYIQPKFASREEKYKVFSESRQAKRTEPHPPYCTHVIFERFFIIEKFKMVHSAPTDEKPERIRK